MNIKAGILAAIFLMILFATLTVWGGIQALRSGRKIPYYRLKQERIVHGWRLFFLGVLLALAAYWMGSYGEPTVYMFYKPSVTPSLTPTITLTLTTTLTPTVTPTPSITLTPAISNTPPFTSTPFMPAAVGTLFKSVITPNPDAIFSPLVFGRSIDLTNYQAVDPGNVFQNPIKRIVALYSYDNMVPGAQWTALWYRDGTLVHYETAAWDGTTGGQGYADWAPDPSEWQPGNYEVQIFVGLDWKVVGRFTVKGKAPAAKATPRASATVTDTASPVTHFTLTRTPTLVPTSTPPPSATPPPSSTLQPTLTRPPTDTPWPSVTPTITQTRFPTSTPRPTDTPWPKAE